MRVTKRGGEVVGLDVEGAKGERWRRKAVEGVDITSSATIWSSVSLHSVRSIILSSLYSR